MYTVEGFDLITRRHVITIALEYYMTVWLRVMTGGTLPLAIDDLLITGDISRSVRSVPNAEREMLITSETRRRRKREKGGRRRKRRREKGWRRDAHSVREEEKEGRRGRTRGEREMLIASERRRRRRERAVGGNVCVFVCLSVCVGIRSKYWMCVANVILKHLLLSVYKETIGMVFARRHRKH